MKRLGGRIKKFKGSSLYRESFNRDIWSLLSLHRAKLFPLLQGYSVHKAEKAENQNI